MVQNIKVVFYGSSRSGKSSLITKLSKPSSIVEPEDKESKTGYWRTQYAGAKGNVNVEVDGQTYRVKLSEVRGSRGRSSNYREILTQFETADATVFTFRVDRYSKPDYFKRESANYERMMRSAKTAAAKKANKAKKQNKNKNQIEYEDEDQDESNEDAIDGSKLPPLAMWATHADTDEYKEHIKPFREAMTFFETSAVTGFNLKEALKDLVKRVIESKANLSQEAPVTDKLLPKTNVDLSVAPIQHGVEVATAL